MGIQCVIFDIDNTLYSYDAAHAVAFERLTAFVQERLGLGAQAFHALHRETMAALKRRMGDVAATHNRFIRYQNILEGLGADPRLALEMDELYWSSLLEAAVPMPGAAETLEALRSRGIRLGVGTDMTARMQFLKLERLGLLPLIDFMVSSEEAGAEKPEARFFALCVEKARVPAENCLFVGDSLEKDALGSQRCGLRGVWFHSAEEAARAGTPRIGQLRELTALVEQA